MASDHQLRGAAFKVMVAAMVMLSCLLAAVNAAGEAPTTVLSVRNGFPDAKLSVQCESDTERHPPRLVWPQAVEAFPFDPSLHKYWNCSIFTAVPASTFPREGKFILYARVLAPKACTPICDWKADFDGLWVPLTLGGQHRLVYPWQEF